MDQGNICSIHRIIHNAAIHENNIGTCLAISFKDVLQFMSKRFIATKKLNGIENFTFSKRNMFCIFYMNASLLNLGYDEGAKNVYKTSSDILVLLLIPPPLGILYFL